MRAVVDVCRVVGGSERGGSVRMMVISDVCAKRVVISGVGVCQSGDGDSRCVCQSADTR